LLNTPSLARRAAVHHALGDVHRLAIVDALRCSDRTPSELATLTVTASNLLAHHLDVLEVAGVITRGPSQGDGRRRYVRLRADVLRQLAQPVGAVEAHDVLFVCTHNAARSQLAAGLWQRRTGRPARSAGHRPADAVHPLAREVAAAHGIDLTAAPRGYDAIDPLPDLVVSVCDRAHEAGVPFDVPTLHWSVPDPSAGDRRAFEAAFAELADRIDVLATSAVVTW
jgi:ArsR family transcriptional regulator, arsenate/arsenite/antimonite-responsive transcriptional repressor / arsenate reductase (thioredoxin)